MIPIKEIPFTDEHIEKIRNGEKRSTMRTVKRKNLFPEHTAVPIKDSDHGVKIGGRKIIVYGPETLDNYGNPTHTSSIFSRVGDPRDVLASTEGFESPEEMLEWFQNRRYDLPQPFFLYWIKKFVPNLKEKDNDGDMK